MRPGQSNLALLLRPSFLLPPGRLCRFVSLYCVMGSHFQASRASCHVGRRLDQRVSKLHLPRAPTRTPCPCSALRERYISKHPDLAGLTGSHLVPTGCSPEPRGRGPGAARTRARGEDGTAPGVCDPGPAPWPTHGGHRQPAAQCRGACDFHPSLPHPASWQHLSQSDLTSRQREEGEHEVAQGCARQRLLLRPRWAARGLPDFRLPDKRAI